MAASLGVRAFGTDIRVDISGTYTSVSEVKDISGPQIVSEYVDYTTFRSTGGFRERKATYKSSGEVRFRCNYLHADTTHAKLVAVASADPATLSNFRIVFPDNSRIDFSAYVNVEWSAPLNSSLEMAVTLSISGVVEWAAPSPSVSPSVSPSASPSAS